MFHIVGRLPQLPFPLPLGSTSISCILLQPIVNLCHHADLVEKDHIHAGPTEETFIPQISWELGILEDTVGTNEKYMGTKVGELGGGGPAMWGEER